MVKNPPVNARDLRDQDSIPELERSLGGGHGTLLQCSRLENLMNRGAWRATIHRVEKCFSYPVVSDSLQPNGL